LDSRVVRFRNPGGAVVTDCVFAAKAAGDVDDVRPVLASIIAKDAEYEPDAEKTALYRALFDLRRRLVKADMGPAFETLARIRARAL
ncbi:MAG: carbohydrate kinase, partial [Duodenibacillus sp.]|nr:carbohydrate kinase [Duodenibacillus sp.]